MVLAIQSIASSYGDLLHGAVGLAHPREPRAGGVVCVVEEVVSDNARVVDFKDLGLIVGHKDLEIVAGRPAGTGIRHL